MGGEAAFRFHDDVMNPVMCAAGNLDVDRAPD
jgi:hypothetical protein